MIVNTQRNSIPNRPGDIKRRDLPAGISHERMQTKCRIIRTDGRMETNLRGVFAAGDCAEVQHLVTGRPTYIPLGTTANKAGRVAGANAAGGRERFAGIVGTSIVGIFGMGFATAGFSAEQARAEGFSRWWRASKARAAALLRRRRHRGGTGP